MQVEIKLFLERTDDEVHMVHANNCANATPLLQIGEARWQSFSRHLLKQKHHFTIEPPRRRQRVGLATPLSTKQDSDWLFAHIFQQRHQTNWTNHLHNETHVVTRALPVHQGVLSSVCHCLCSVSLLSVRPLGFARAHTDTKTSSQSRCDDHQCSSTWQVCRPFVEPRSLLKERDSGGLSRVCPVGRQRCSN